MLIMGRKALFIIYALTLASFALASETEIDKSSSKDAATIQDKDSKSTAFSAFVQSFTSMIVSEFGDNTFLMAAIMSMRYSRAAVLGGTIVALVLMTIISTAFGSIVPVILTPQITDVIVTLLFFFFGGKLLYDAYKNDDDDDEEEEVEKELNQVHSKILKTTKKSGRKETEIDQKLVFWQALTVTFLGEWGDRSQITTIALAAEGHPVAVSIGSFLGNSLCTVLAVMGGKLLAKKISERTVNIAGGVLFLLFGIFNLVRD